MTKCILIDKERNKTIGLFDSLREAMQYAKAEGLKAAEFEQVEEKACK